MASKANRTATFAGLAAKLGTKLRPPFGIILGSPLEVAELATALPTSGITCYQMDLFQTDRLRVELKDHGCIADVVAAADLWDLPAEFQTAIYPVPQGGERALKIDMVEQAFHILRPQGNLIVLSPFQKDELFPQTLKKVFGKVHNPMTTGTSVYWSQRDKEHPRRRHEMIFQTRVDETTSWQFLSRPGVFSYGKFDNGARALVEAMEIHDGERILDLGCGIGTNGLFALRQAGPKGYCAFVDSNLRALAVAEHNVRVLGFTNWRTHASCTIADLDEKPFDVVLANPPYYAQLTIARLFIERGHALLKPGGRFYLVTRQPDQIFPIVAEFFGEPEMFESRGYILFVTHKKK